MTIGGIDREELDAFRRGLFGFSAPGRTVPMAYVRTLFGLIKDGDPKLGVVVSDTRREAYWVHGRTLGVLACEGSTDKDAEICGRVIAFDHLAGIAVDVTVSQGDFSDDYQSGRKLTIRHLDGEIVLDAAPGKLNGDATEAFIDEVLKAFAAR